MKYILSVVIFLLGIGSVNAYYGYDYNSCYKTYGLYSRDNYDGTCTCAYGYHFGKDSLGYTKCVEDTYDYKYPLLQMTDSQILLGDGYTRYVVDIRYSCSFLSKYVGGKIIVTQESDFGGPKRGDKIYDGYNECELGFSTIEYGDYNITCPDMRNGYLGSDHKCYCNKGYKFSSSLNMCRKVGGRK